MASFRFERRRGYTDLDLEVSLSVFPDNDLSFTGRGSVKARGLPGARQRWRDEFWEWAQSRNLDAVSPRFGNRRIDGTSVYDCYMRDWQTVADFVVMWIGIDALSDALADPADVERRSLLEIRRLTAMVQSMGEKLALVETYCKRQDDKWSQLRSLLSDTPANVGAGKADGVGAP